MFYAVVIDEEFSQRKEGKGALASIWVDDDEYVAERPNVNVGFVTHEKELILPFFDKMLSGYTAKRLLELAPKLVENGRLKSVTVGNITVEEAKQAAEMMYTGRTIPVLPIIEWDEKPIDDGKVGELTMVLSDLILEDLVRRHTGSRFLMCKRNPNRRICGQNWCCILKSESE
ncbi:putative aminotransferase class IV, aminotransferase-like, PLP-dependent enzyme [Helianthus debilis subsp. tardiflorus]